MFDDIGRKLKGWAVVNFIIYCIVAVAIAIYIISASEWYMLFQALLLGVALFGAGIVSTWFIYGFAELIESAQETNRLLRTGFSENISQEKEKRREEEKARANAANMQRERWQREENAKKARIDAYWREHTGEKQVLLDKRAKANAALSAGGISSAQQKELIEVVSSIDFELTRDR